MEVHVAFKDTKEFIDNLDDFAFAKVTYLIDALTVNGNRIGLPYSRSLGDGLFELRTTGTIEVRLLYCFHRGDAVILHTFIKKTMKTPLKEIRISRQRMRQIE